MGDQLNKKKKFPIFTIIKNIWIREGEKAKQRKGNHVKKPRGYRSRSVGRIVFWVLFSFMFIVVITNVLSPSSAQGKKEPVIQQKNQAASQEAVQFAEDFSREYFTWEKTDKSDWMLERQERLSKFLAEGLDEDGGLSTNQLDWSSKLESSKLVKIEEKGDNKAFITLEVNAAFTKKSKVEEVTKKDGKEEKKQVEKEENAPFVKYFVVPVAYQNGTYGVYELPKYTNIQRKTKVEMQQREGLTEYQGDQQAIISFMNTFFTSYAEDSNTKLSYMVADSSRVQGLQGSMKFVELKDSEIKKDEKGNIQAFTTVVLKDEKTGAQFNTDYSLTIAKQKDRLLVKELNAQ